MAIDLSSFISSVEANGTDADFRGKFGELIFTNTITANDFTVDNTLVTGINYNQSIGLMDYTPDFNFLKSSGTLVGGCAYHIGEVNGQASAEIWQPADYEVRVPICLKNANVFTNAVKSFWNIRANDLKLGVLSDQSPEVVLANFYDYLSLYISQSINASYSRIGFMDAKSKFTTPGLENFSGIDGLFYQLRALTPLNDDKRIVITQNSGATISAQMNSLPATFGVDILQAMYDQASETNSELLSKSGLRFDVTFSVANSYLQYLRVNKEQTCCFSINNDGYTSSGYSLDNLNFLGIPIKVRKEWHQLVVNEATLTGATAYLEPHKALLSTPNSRLFGTTLDDAFGIKDMFYDRKDATIYIDVLGNLDAKVADKKNFIYAY
jgi:hypothetical protein